MGASISIGRLSAAVTSACKDRVDRLTTQVEADVLAVSRDVATRLRRGGPFKRDTGKYQRAWRAAVSSSDMRTVGIVHNRGHAGLTHLLEEGHRIENQYGRQPGRARAYPHIAPAYERGAAELLRRMGAR